MTYDLVLRGGRVIDPSRNIDRITDVAFAGGKFVALGDDLKGASERNVAGLIVTPGLIDLHTHVYYGGTSLGVDPEAYARRSAVTTLVDTGSAGPGNFAGFRDHVISKSTPRIVAYLNISFAGIFGFAKRVYVGENGDQRLLSLEDDSGDRRSKSRSHCGHQGAGRLPHPARRSGSCRWRSRAKRPRNCGCR